jgi:hypothetical protein
LTRWEKTFKIKEAFLAICNGGVMIFTLTTTLSMQGGRKHNKEEEEESKSERTCREMQGDGWRYVQS